MIEENDFEKQRIARLRRAAQSYARQFGFSLRCPGRRQYQLLDTDGNQLAHFDSIGEANGAIKAAAFRRLKEARS